VFPTLLFEFACDLVLRRFENQAIATSKTTNKMTSKDATIKWQLVVVQLKRIVGERFITRTLMSRALDGMSWDRIRSSWFEIGRLPAPVSTRE
jgi:hypothetical protein